ncbi:unnamed protein product [Trichogramma brassicae]|uniref:Mff-like domain-containing protein n=1 Tax=Trichogramma brassicae TaxID=86971 RepID=A0A6H5I7J3_9HYME|nr:unnamed protein product [Trichogramma brassicae]
MANAHSPTRFNGEADSFYDSNFTLDINQKMRVPKSIRVAGDYMEDDMPNGNTWTGAFTEKLEMNVPDRILVVGQEQHIGTKAPPREIAIENAVLPKSEPTYARCITPPRVLTLDTHNFPTVDEDNRAISNGDVMTPIKPQEQYIHETPALVRSIREQTPYGVLDTTLPPGDEVQHLKRQIGKLNRRVMAIESEIQQQQQRMKLIYVISAFYVCLKTIFWFGKN